MGRSAYPPSPYIASDACGEAETHWPDRILLLESGKQNFASGIGETQCGPTKGKQSKHSQRAGCALTFPPSVALNTFSRGGARSKGKRDVTISVDRCSMTKRLEKQTWIQRNLLCCCSLSFVVGCERMDLTEKRKRFF